MICVILAIGVDDMYVMCFALSREDPVARPTVRERVGSALRQVGMSITMTSTTDAVAFALAAVDGAPGVQAFAINASLAVVFDFALQVSLEEMGSFSSSVGHFLLAAAFSSFQNSSAFLCRTWHTPGVIGTG